MSPRTNADIAPESFLPLTPAVFHILAALADGERHGYSIMQSVATASGGHIKLGPGTLYGAIGRLLKDRLIVESEDRPEPDADDSRRHYYRLTNLGQHVFALETERLANLVKLAKATRVVRAWKPA